MECLQPKYRPKSFDRSRTCTCPRGMFILYVGSRNSFCSVVVVFLLELFNSCCLFKLGVGVVKYGFEELPTVWNKPNGHGFIHYLKITLPALRNGRFSCSSMFEKTHGLAKRVNRISGKYSYEENALSKIHRKSTLRFAACGSHLDKNGKTFGKAVNEYLFPSQWCSRPPSFCNAIAPLKLQAYTVSVHQAFLKVYICLFCLFHCIQRTVSLLHFKLIRNTFRSRIR